MGELIQLSRCGKGLPRRKHSAVEQQGMWVHTASAPPGVEEGGGVGADAAWRREDQAKEWRLDSISISWL